VRACYAALRMQESLRRGAEQILRPQGTPVNIRVGLNSGEVVVRSIGSDLRMDYTAVGQTTHLAARMEQMATPGSILVTDASRRLAEGYVEVKPLRLVLIKGLREPVAVHELTGAEYRPLHRRRARIGGRSGPGGRPDGVTGFLPAPDVRRGRREEGRLMRIVVDLNRCLGYAQCVFLAPDVFTLHGEEALRYDPNPDEAQRLRVLRAAAACPVKAIVVERLDDAEGSATS